MKNSEIAARLCQHAHEINSRHENLFRARAYRRAAESILRLNDPVELIVKHAGVQALEHIPGIGRRIAREITNLIDRH